MKEITINKTIESEVELMISLARQAEQLRKNYPECWSLLAKQFQLKDYQDIDFIQDDIENIKISLYAGIVRKNNRDSSAKLIKINSKLSK